MKLIVKSIFWPDQKASNEYEWSQGTGYILIVGHVQEPSEFRSLTNQSVSTWLACWMNTSEVQTPHPAYYIGGALSTLAESARGPLADFWNGISEWTFYADCNYTNIFGGFFQRNRNLRPICSGTAAYNRTLARQRQKSSQQTNSDSFGGLFGFFHNQKVHRYATYSLVDSAAYPLESAGKAHMVDLPEVRSGLESAHLIARKYGRTYICHSTHELFNWISEWY